MPILFYEFGERLRKRFPVDCRGACPRDLCRISDMQARQMLVSKDLEDNTGEQGQRDNVLGASFSFGVTIVVFKKCRKRLIRDVVNQACLH